MGGILPLPLFHCHQKSFGVRRRRADCGISFNRRGEDRRRRRQTAKLTVELCSYAAGPAGRCTSGPKSRQIVHELRVRRPVPFQAVVLPGEIKIGRPERRCRSPTPVFQKESSEAVRISPGTGTGSSVPAHPLSSYLKYS